MSAIQTAVAALYLRGLPRPAEPHARSWPQVLSCLRRAGEVSRPELVEALNDTGLYLEATALGSAAFGHAERLAERGLLLTVASDAYPRRWIERLGATAPPAFFARGDQSLLALPGVAVVGSRKPPGVCLRQAKEVSASATQLQKVVISGGAPGIDRVVSVAGSFIEVWPCGLAMSWGARASGSSRHLALSLWPPREPFSTAGAMERNTLVYALAEAAFLGHARFKQGGTWHGASDAARRRLTRLVVTAAPWPPDAEPARRAFVGLGAVELQDTGALALSAALNAEPLQPWLPGFSPTPDAGRALTAW